MSSSVVKVVACICQSGYMYLLKFLHVFVKLGTRIRQNSKFLFKTFIIVSLQHIALCKTKLCIYDYDEHAHLRYCRTGRHLRRCEDITCPAQFKCPGNFSGRCRVYVLVDVLVDVAVVVVVLVDAAVDVVVFVFTFLTRTI